MTLRRDERAGSALPGPDRLHNVPVRPTTSRGTWAAWALPALCLAVFVVTVLLDVRVPAELAGDGLVAEPGWATGLTGLVFGSLAALVLVRDRTQGFGWALGWFGLFWALDGLAQAYVRLGLDTDRPLPAMTFAVWFLLRFTALLPVTVAVLLLLFPTGRLPEGRWGTAGAASLGVMALGALVFVVAPADGFGSEGRLPVGTDPDPTTISALAPYADTLVPAALAISIAAFFVPMACVVVRYRRSRGIERDRMRWLLWAVIAMALIIVAVLLLDLGWAEQVLLFVQTNVAPAAMTVAVVRPDLVDVEQLLGGTLLYGALSLIVLGIDLALLAAVTAVAGDRLEERQAVALALLVAVLVYGPLRTRLRGVVRRLVLGDRDAPYDAVAGLAASLETVDEGSAQLAAVAAAVAAAFRVSYVCVEVERGGGELLRATHGEPPAQTRSLPITYRGTVTGRLVLPARGVRSRLTRRDEQLLGDLVRQAATAARTSQLAAELQDNRERLVVAREEERRRIRRDLHDGLGPALSGVVFQLESARLLVDRDPEVAKATLGETSTYVQDVVADVRRLVHELRPPALDDRGLVGALEQQAERTTVAGTRTSVHAGELGPLPAAVEVAAFRIVAEAMTNVVRHAGAARCDVRLDVVDSELLVEVVDDGSGIAPEAEAGIGLVSMRERAGELGGRSEVTCPPEGGTVVRAWLPLRRSA